MTARARSSSSWRRLGMIRTGRTPIGALASLEQSLGEDTLVSLVERFETQRFSARDVIALLQAGLHGGGHAELAARIDAVEISGGPVAASQAAAQLLVRAFAPEGT